MRLYVAIALSALLSTSTAQAGHHEMGEAIGSAVIGTVFSKEQQAKDMVVGDLSHQQIWVDYIKAHNDRDLDKISDINTDDWTGYVPDGSVVKGSAAHIEWLADWFASLKGIASQNTTYMTFNLLAVKLKRFTCTRDLPQVSSTVRTEDRTIAGI